MKNIIFLVAAVCFIFTSCQKEEAFDEIVVETITEEPQEINPEISFRAVDKNGTPLSDVKLQVFDQGNQKLEVFTDETGSVTTELPSEGLEKRLLLLGEKEIYNSNVLRIEPEQIESGIVEITLTPVEESTPTSQTNVASLLSSNVALVNGQVTDNTGNPGGFIAYIYELDAILNGDTTLFQNYVFIDQQGFYEMLVPKDIELVLSIFEFDACSEDQFKTINAEDIPLQDGYFGEFLGTFSEDTTLPTNTSAGQITGQPIDLTFNGTIIDCDGLPVENSMVSIYTIDFTGGSLVGTTSTDPEGNFSQSMNIGCIGFPGFVAVINSPNTPQFSYSTGYIEGEATVEFGELESCGKSFFTISNHTNTGQIRNNNLQLTAYEPGVSVTVTEKLNATDQFLLTGQTDANGNWRGSAFEFYENGQLLYRSITEDFSFQVIDDGDRLRMNTIGFEVEILSGPDAGMNGALFQGSATIFK